jgi:hypothetical protein
MRVKVTETRKKDALLQDDIVSSAMGSGTENDQILPLSLSLSLSLAAAGGIFMNDGAGPSPTHRSELRIRRALDAEYLRLLRLRA